MALLLNFAGVRCSWTVTSALPCIVVSRIAAQDAHLQLVMERQSFVSCRNASGTVAGSATRHNLLPDNVQTVLDRMLSWRLPILL